MHSSHPSLRFMPVLLAALVAACAGKPAVPPVEAATAAPPASAIVRTNANIGDGSDTPIRAAVVRAVFVTANTPLAARERCGEQVKVAPLPSGWFSSKPSPDGDIPPPVFWQEASCDVIAEREVRAAHYRVVYQFQGEEYSVDLDEAPGATVAVDSAGRVVQRAARR